MTIHFYHVDTSYVALYGGTIESWYDALRILEDFSTSRFVIRPTTQRGIAIGAVVYIYARWVSPK